MMTPYEKFERVILLLAVIVLALISSRKGGGGKEPACLGKPFMPNG
jgi:hypothetical protein